jgi:hypothetical protein
VHCELTRGPEYRGEALEARHADPTILRGEIRVRVEGIVDTVAVNRDKEEEEEEEEEEEKE